MTVLPAAPLDLAALACLEEEFAATPSDVIVEKIVTVPGVIERKVAHLTSLRAYQEGWRKALCAELFELPSPIRTARDRSRYCDLELSIRTLDAGLRVLADTGVMLEELRLGALMCASGFQRNLLAPAGEMGLRLPWLGSIPEVERKIADLTARRDDAQARLDAALRESLSARGDSCCELE